MVRSPILWVEILLIKCFFDGNSNCADYSINLFLGDNQTGSKVHDVVQSVETGVGSTDNNTLSHDITHQGCHLTFGDGFLGFAVGDKLNSAKERIWWLVRPASITSNCASRACSSPFSYNNCRNAVNLLSCFWVEVSCVVFIIHKFSTRGHFLLYATCPHSVYLKSSTPSYTFSII